MRAGLRRVSGWRALLSVVSLLAAIGGCRDAADGVMRQDTTGWAALSWRVEGELLPLVSSAGEGDPEKLRREVVRVWGGRLRTARDHGVLAVTAVRDVTEGVGGDGEPGGPPAPADTTPFRLEVDLKVPPPCTPEAAFATSDVLHAVLEDRGAFGFHAVHAEGTRLAADRLRALDGVRDVSTRSALGGLLVATVDPAADRAALLEALGLPLADLGAIAVPVPPAEAGPAVARSDAAQTLVLAVVRSEASLTDRDVERADLLPARDGVARVVVRFLDRSAPALAALTEAERGRHLLVLDGRGELVTAPVVGMRISDGRFELRLGHGSPRDARAVAAILGAGRLPAEPLFADSKLACQVPGKAPIWLERALGVKRR